MVKCAIVGAKGYTGCELIKILVKHPDVELSFLGSRDEEPVSAASLVPNMRIPANLFVEQNNVEKILSSSDVVFLALPHTQSMEFVKAFVGKEKIIIDLSADFRFQDVSRYEKWYKVSHAAKELCANAVYGLADYNKKAIQKAEIIANPGCYPTAVLLSLMPLVEKGLIDTASIVVDAKSGVSGAGKKCTDVTHFCEVDENFQAYKVNNHQHMPEMEEKLSLRAQEPVSLMFVPHLLPLMRGILATSYVKKKPGIVFDDIAAAYYEAYHDAAFVRMLPPGTFPQIKHVAHSNFCDLQCIDAGEHVIIVSAIDNLVKGASGQAVQNMNIRLGFDEGKGLL